MSGDNPKTVYSINPAAWQFWVAVATLAVLFFSSQTWIVGREFDQRLIKFHAVAKPEIVETINTAVAAHAAMPAHGSVIQRLSARENRDAGADEQLKAIRESLADMKAQNAEMNKKIDRLLER